MSKRAGTFASHRHLALLFAVFCALWWVVPGSSITGVEDGTSAEVQRPSVWDRVLRSADSLVSQGEYDSAIVLGRLALDEVESTHKSDDTLTARVLYQLGYYAYLGVSKYHKARHLFEADHLEAESALKRSLGIWTRLLGANHPDVANCQLTLADLYNIQGRHDKAEGLYREALRVRKQTFGPVHTEVAEVMDRIGQVLKNRGKYDQSEAYYDSALTILIDVFGPDSPGLVQAISQLALLYCHQGRYNLAARHYLWALDILEKEYGTDHELVAACLYDLLDVHQAQGSYTEGERICRRVLRIQEEIHGPESSIAAQCLTRLSDFCRFQGKYSEAEDYNLQARKIYQKVLKKEHPDVAVNLASLAALYKAQGRYPEAVPLYQRALEIFGNTLWEDNPSQAEVLQDLATIYLYQGKSNEAESALDTAISIMTEVFPNRRSKRTGAMMDMSRVYESQGRFKDAERICTEVLQILSEEFGSQHQAVAACHDRLAEVYRHQLKYSEAEGQYVRALAIRLRSFGPDHQETARTRTDLARLYRDQGDFQRAEQAFLQALEGYRKSLGVSHPDYAACQADLARDYFALGRNTEAIRLLESSADVYQQCFGPENPDYAETIRTLAEVCGSAGDFERCMRYYREFLSLREAFLGYVFSNSSSDQKLMWIDKFPLIDDALIALALRRNTASCSGLAMEMVLKGKGKVIDALMAEKELAFCSVDPELQSMLGRHREVTTLIANMVTAHTVSESHPWRPDSLQALQRIKDSLETELSRRCSEFRKDLGTRRFELADVAAALPDDAVLWEIISCEPPVMDRQGSERHEEPRFVGLILNSEGTVNLVDLGDVKSLEAQVEQCRQRIYNSYDDLYSSEAAWSEELIMRATSGLYDRLFAPMIARSGSSTRLLVSPDGALNLIPLEILAGPDGRYVLEKYRISYLSSGKDLLRYKDGRVSEGEAVMLADPDFDAPQADSKDVLRPTTPRGFGNVFGTPEEEQRGQGDCRNNGFTRLAWTSEEAALVADIIDEQGGISVRRYIGAQATEHTVKALVKAPRILHMATHGFFCNRESLPGGMAGNNPLLRSGLALAGANRVAETQSLSAGFGEDGILTAYEVSGLNLMGTELATLSACETGLGEVVDGEGVFGMRRAFQHAGAESILMSLWRVPDKATTALMREFYTRWLKGTPKADALRESSLQLLHQTRRERGHGHPLMWGGFVLAGNPN